MPAKYDSPVRDTRGAVDPHDDLWQSTWPRPAQPARSGVPSSRPVSERRVYRADGPRDEERGDGRRSSAGIRTRPGRRRSRLLAVMVLVLVAVVIALAGVAAKSSAFDGSQGDTGTFKLLPITTTTTS